MVTRASKPSRFINGVRISPYFTGPDDSLTYTHSIGMTQSVELRCNGRSVICAVTENGEKRVYGYDYSDSAKAYRDLISLGRILRKSVLPPLPPLRSIEVED